MMYLRHIFRVVWPVLFMWFVLLSIAIGTEATWPESQHGDFVLIACIGTFDVLLATIMLRRMRGLDWLTIALSAVFLTKGMVWFYFTARHLWPEFFLDYNQEVLWVLRSVLVFVLISAFLMLILTPDGSYAEQQRAEGVVEGYAEGVADERTRERRL